MTKQRPSIHSTPINNFVTYILTILINLSATVSGICPQFSGKFQNKIPRKPGNNKGTQAYSNGGTISYKIYIK